MNKEKREQVSYTFLIDANVLRYMEDAAHKNERSTAYMIRRAIAQYIIKNDNKKKG